MLRAQVQKTRSAPQENQMYVAFAVCARASIGITTYMLHIICHIRFDVFVCVCVCPRNTCGRFSIEHTYSESGRLFVGHIAFASFGLKNCNISDNIYKTKISLPTYLPRTPPICKYSHAISDRLFCNLFDFTAARANA